MIFDTSKCSSEKKLANFPKYVRRQNIARFLVQYEIFKKQLGVKGSIVECGVHHGGGVMAWAKMSSTLEPYNYRRTIVGFDTFEGFPDVKDIDKQGGNPIAKAGAFSEDYNTYEELKEVVVEYDENRFLNHISKVDLVKGDACKKIPEYIEQNPHLLVSLLYLDFDIYEPTVVALEHLLPRIPKGGIVAFDEVHNKDWPGETKALLEKFNLNEHALESFPFEPNISYIQF